MVPDVLCFGICAPSFEKVNSLFAIYILGILPVSEPNLNVYYKKVFNYRVSLAKEKVTGCFRSGAGNGVLPHSETHHRKFIINR